MGTRITAHGHRLPAHYRIRSTGTVIFHDWGWLDKAFPGPVTPIEEGDTTLSTASKSCLALHLQARFSLSQTDRQYCISPADHLRTIVGTWPCSYLPFGLLPFSFSFLGAILVLYPVNRDVLCTFLSALLTWGLVSRDSLCPVGDGLTSTSIYGP